MSTFLNALEFKWSKTWVIVGGCVAAGFTTYILYSHYKNKSRMVDEGFEDITVSDDSKKVIVLGLDGAGKSTFLTQLSRTEENSLKAESSNGSTVVSVHCKNGKTLNISEIGGSENIRVYWSNFVQDTDLLVYIVDSCDDHRLAESVKELRILTACDNLKKIPIVILANKQDLKNSASPESIGGAFGIPELSRQNKIAVFPLAMPPCVEKIPQSVISVKEVIVNLCFGK